MTRTALILPTLEASRHWEPWLAALRTQSVCPDEVLVIDSASSDDTAARARAAGFRVHVIARADFDHGGTRKLAAGLVDAEILIYMTQDAVLADAGSLARLVAAFTDDTIGAAYGRQLPRPGATPIEAHARLFNYAATSHTRGAADIPRLGFKATFLSDVFAAYRRRALEAIGGFPDRALFGEDAHVAARMVLAGWRIAYRADATVYHSHAYTALQELRRYFDIGAFHAHERWIGEAFGSPRGEGLRFVRSELAYLGRRGRRWIPSALLRTACKLGGYRLGMQHRLLPRALNRRLSMFPPYWSAR